MDYAKLSVVELREMAKKSGATGYSRLAKPMLIECVRVHKGKAGDCSYLYAFKALKGAAKRAPAKRAPATPAKKSALDSMTKEQLLNLWYDLYNASASPSETHTPRPPTGKDGLRADIRLMRKGSGVKKSGVKKSVAKKAPAKKSIVRKAPVRKVAVKKAKSPAKKSMLDGMNKEQLLDLWYRTFNVQNPGASHTPRPPTTVAALRKSIRTMQSQFR